jgi:CRISPR/Cas system CMR-associated protein Cmr5 small subunit
MYFKVSMRTNPASGLPEGYYRLVESYRNEYNRICHRTLLNIGFLRLPAEKLNAIKAILNDRLERRQSLFEHQQEDQVRNLANQYWEQLVEKGKVDVSDQAFEKKRRMVDVDTLKHKDAREVGAEWMCFQAVEQLQIRQLLERLGWQKEQIELALIQIISRAIYPYSENRTCKWIKENSAVCEVTKGVFQSHGKPTESLKDHITKDKLYESALRLFEIKDQLEPYLSKRTNELFDLHDRIVLYDLTNTYFEGVKAHSKLAQHNKSKSKEKRDDAKLIVLALVINMEGFIKFSSVFEGKKSDSSSLGDIVEKIRINTTTDKRAIVVLDAGIATEDNLALLQNKGYDYVCVSRSKISQYTLDKDFTPQYISTNNKHKVTLEKVISKHTTDYLLKVHSQGKQYKEQSMKSLFQDRFMQEIDKARVALDKKGGIKTEDKVQRRIGRIIEKYPSIAKHYLIEVKAENQIAKQINLIKKESYQKDENHLGVYFIRTNLKTEEQSTVWQIYNSIREIESSFRSLKTELNLRPVYHKNDDATVAHLHLGLLAYWVVNTVRYQLKQKGINHSWSEILRITNTQKVVTTSGQNTFDEIIYIRKCTEPNEKVKQIYNALGYKNYPFVKRKSVVHKSELKKNKTTQFKLINDS